MSTSTPLQNIDTNLWFMEYPLKALGVDMHRNVTIIRLASGKLIIHSTAPFTTADVQAIHALGEPAWMLDVLLRHDTFSAEGQKAFPGVRYLVPVGFPKVPGVSNEPMLPPPDEWADEIETLPIDGAPGFGEIVMLHRPTRTLVVGDFVFNFEGEQGLWKKILLKVATVGGRYQPGFTRPFKMAINDPSAIAASARNVLSWDFDRIIVGHGNPIPSGGKEKLRSLLQSAGVI